MAKVPQGILVGKLVRDSFPGVGDRKTALVKIRTLLRHCEAVERGYADTLETWGAQPTGYMFLQQGSFRQKLWVQHKGSRAVGLSAATPENRHPGAWHTSYCSVFTFSLNINTRVVSHTCTLNTKEPFGHSN